MDRAHATKPAKPAKPTKTKAPACPECGDRHGADEGKLRVKGLPKDHAANWPSWTDAHTWTPAVMTVVR